MGKSAKKRAQLSLPVRYSVVAEHDQVKIPVNGRTHTTEVWADGVTVRWSRWWRCQPCPHAIDFEETPPCKLSACPYIPEGEPMPPLDYLQLEITLPSTRGKLNAKARPVAVKETSVSDTFHLELEFVEISAEEQAELAALVEDALERPDQVQEVERIDTSVPRLVVMSQPLEGKVFPITRKAFSIGRAQTSDLCLPNLRVSREHAIVRVREGKYIIYDLGSTNGTYVNRQRIRFRELSDGDRISIGPIKLVFHAPGSEVK